jgi:hypothetical protein
MRALFLFRVWSCVCTGVAALSAALGLMSILLLFRSYHTEDFLTWRALNVRWSITSERGVLWLESFSSAVSPISDTAEFTHFHIEGDEPPGRRLNWVMWGFGIARYKYFGRTVTTIALRDWLVLVAAGLSCSTILLGRQLWNASRRQCGFDLCGTRKEEIATTSREQGTGFD